MTIYYNLIGIRDSGYDGHVSMVEEFDLESAINFSKFHAVKSGSNVQLFKWTSKHEVTSEMVSDPKYLDRLKVNADKVF